MKKQKFRIGDRVKITKPIDTALWAAGLTGRIYKKDNSDIPYLVELDDSRPRRDGSITARLIWSHEVELLEPRPVYPVIVITTDGKTMTAIKRQGNKTIKKVEARCKCSDHFDFNAGALLALSSLAGARIINADMCDGPLRIGIDELLNKQEPDMFSGKIVCTQSDDSGRWIAGKVYELKNGAVRDELGDLLEGVESVSDMNTAMGRFGHPFRFIPYVE